MPVVEVYQVEARNDLEKLLFVGDFDFLPRQGDHIGRERDGYHRYYDIVKVWFRSEGETDTYRACVEVVEDD